MSPTSATEHRHSPVLRLGRTHRGRGCCRCQRWLAFALAVEWANAGSVGYRRSSKERRICRALESKFGDDRRRHALQGCVRLNLKARPRLWYGDAWRREAAACTLTTVLETLRESIQWECPSAGTLFRDVGLRDHRTRRPFDAMLTLAAASIATRSGALRIRQQTRSRQAGGGIQARHRRGCAGGGTGTATALPSGRGQACKHSFDDAKRAFAAVLRQSPRARPSCRDPELLLMLQIHLTSVWVGLSPRPLGVAE